MKASVFFEERDCLIEQVSNMVDDLDMASDRVGSAYLDNDFSGELRCVLCGDVYYCCPLKLRASRARVCVHI